MKNKASNEKPEQQNRIGGQAIIEGVMMRGKDKYSLAVRAPDKTITTKVYDIKKSTGKVRNLPILRGIFGFVDSLVIGTRTLTESAEMAGLNDETEEPTKFERWLSDKLGDKLNDYLIYFSVIIAITISVALFMLLPTWISSFSNKFIGDNTWALGIIEGIVRICIFIVYIFLISRMKDVQRLFGYHGAEHKTINCYESNDELTVENVRKHSRLHKRCGTSFLLIIMVISMIVFLIVRTDIIWLRVLFRIIFVPLIAGLSYEVIRWAGSSESSFVKIVSYPGMLMQRITTSEPTDDQIEVAIASVREVLVNDKG